MRFLLFCFITGKHPYKAFRIIANALKKERGFSKLPPCQTAEVFRAAFQIFMQPALPRRRFCPTAALLKAEKEIRIAKARKLALQLVM